MAKVRKPGDEMPGGPPPGANLPDRIAIASDLDQVASCTSGLIDSIRSRVLAAQGDVEQTIQDLLSTYRSQVQDHQGVIDVCTGAAIRHLQDKVLAAQDQLYGLLAKWDPELQVLIGQGMGQISPYSPWPGAISEAVPQLTPPYMQPGLAVRLTGPTVTTVTFPYDPALPTGPVPEDDPNATPPTMPGIGNDNEGTYYDPGELPTDQWGNTIYPDPPTPIPPIASPPGYQTPPPGVPTTPYFPGTQPPPPPASSYPPPTPPPPTGSGGCPPTQVTCPPPVVNVSCGSDSTSMGIPGGPPPDPGLPPATLTGTLSPWQLPAIHSEINPRPIGGRVLQCPASLASQSLPGGGIYDPSDDLLEAGRDDKEWTSLVLDQREKGTPEKIFKARAHVIRFGQHLAEISLGKGRKPLMISENLVLPIVKFMIGDANLKKHNVFLKNLFRDTGNWGAMADADAWWQVLHEWTDQNTSDLYHIQLAQMWWQQWSDYTVSLMEGFKLDRGESSVRTIQGGVSVPLSSIHGVDYGEAILDRDERSDAINEYVQLSRSHALVILPCLEILQLMVQLELPGRIPTPEQVLRCYVRGEMCYGDARYYLRMNGMNDHDVDAIVRAERSSLGPMEIIRARRSGLITDEEYWTRMRGNGWLFRREVQLLDEVTKALPGISDLVRFMVRDSADDALQAKYQGDLELDAKYQGELKSMAQAQGVSDRIMQYAWRAHWEIPGRNTLEEMYHRLRPRGDADWDAKHAVTADDLRTWYAVADVHPWFRQRMEDISYQPLTRVDVRRAFNLGVLSDAEYVSAYRDLGYTEKDAQTLLAFGKALRRQWLLRSSPVKHYVNGVISWAKAKEMLSRWNVSDSELADLHREALTSIKAKHQGRCISAIRRRYLVYELNASQAAKLLTDYGTDADTASTLTDAWACERSAKGRELSAAQLCRLVETTALSPEDQLERLIQMGYSAKDAALITADCTSRRTERLTKRDERDKAAKERERARSERAREAAAKREAAAIGRAERALSREQRAAARRKARWSRIIGRIAKATGEDLVLVGSQADEWIAFSVASWELGIEEAESILDAVSQYKMLASITGFHNAYLDAVLSAVESEEDAISPQ